MFQAVALLLALYVTLRLIRPLPLRPWLKWLLTLLVFATALHHRIVATYWGTRASPEIPSELIMLLGWGFGTLLMAACLLLTLDIVGLLTWALHRPSGQKLLRASRPRATIGVAVMVIAALGVWQAVRVPGVKTIEIALPNLPAELDGFRMAQLTDLHASRLLQQDWMRAVVDKTNALSADLIVITGDLVDGSVAARRNDVAPLQDLSAPHGVFVVAGNHEYYANYVQWMEHFDALGLRLLRNEHTLITRNDAAFALAGITDATAVQHGQPRPDTRAALAGIPAGMLTVLLSHRPANAPLNATAGAHLQLSGHTHGGQILGMHKIVALANGGYVSGLYEVGDMQLYVSNGAGLWPGFPLRVGRPSDITLITLRRAP
ncbi:MAG TPA: metallophosphoesterase [Alcaligenes sp.]|nr:metallophosphoesterase [Alcaligenes sp.]HRL27140.1 metallophosphoesterase [Alcaligenes sp.]